MPGHHREEDGGAIGKTGDKNKIKNKNKGRQANMPLLLKTPAFEHEVLSQTT